MLRIVCGRVHDLNGRLTVDVWVEIGSRRFCYRRPLSYFSDQPAVSYIDGCESRASVKEGSRIFPTDISFRTFLPGEKCK